MPPKVACCREKVLLQQKMFKLQRCILSSHYIVGPYLLCMHAHVSMLIHGIAQCLGCFFASPCTRARPKKKTLQDIRVDLLCININHASSMRSTHINSIALQTKSTPQPCPHLLISIITNRLIHRCILKATRRRSSISSIGVGHQPI